MKGALLICGLMTLNFGLLTINFRAIAKSKYVAAVLTDACIAGLTWTLFKMIAESTNPLERVGYVIGAACGSCLGIYLTRRWDQEGK